MFRNTKQGKVTFAGEDHTRRRCNLPSSSSSLSGAAGCALTDVMRLGSVCDRVMRAQHGSTAGESLPVGPVLKE